MEICTYQRRKPILLTWLVTDGWLEIDKRYLLELCFYIEKHPEIGTYLYDVGLSTGKLIGSFSNYDIPEN